MAFTYEYPRPAVTTDAVIFAYDKNNNDIKILLIQRKNEPYKDFWAFPGGFVDLDESVENCVVRELEEETGLKDVKFEQFFTASEKGRDPRGHTISVFFIALIPINQSIKQGDDAKNVEWISIKNLPKMAFDHNIIYNLALKNLQLKLNTLENHKDFFSDEIIKNNIENIKENMK